MSIPRSLWRPLHNLLPVTAFYFERPMVLFQSDDWGRVGVRDRQGFEQLRSAGIALGERAYDFYTLETAEDLAALRAVLLRHRDVAGSYPCLEMNFITANLDFEKAAGGELLFLPLAKGLPPGWTRPTLIEGYRSGITEGVFTAALHGLSHFCCAAVEGAASDAERGAMLRLFWGAGTPYIHWRMPWIGFEYWDPSKSENEGFLDFAAQKILIGQTVGYFAKLFSSLPASACAPGYRANDDTHQAWSQHGVHIAQNGPGSLMPPHFGRHGLLHLTRTVQFEPATDATCSVENCLFNAERCFDLGIPAIVSMHSINFHSTVKDFRSRTLDLLDQFLTAVEMRHPDLLYLRDEDLYNVINKGRYETTNGSVETKVRQRAFVKWAAATSNP
jgi:hypothetical protein